LLKAFTGAISDNQKDFITVNQLIEIKDIVQQIFTVRGVKVMLDRDLAELYEVDTKVLKQAVRRKAKRFPSNFMFEFTYQ
jgi:hypothetical protein